MGDKAREYYNQEIKEAFIGYEQELKINQNIKDVAGAFFEGIKPYEEMLDKDLYAFNSSEIMGMYKFICTTSLERLMNMNGVFKRYAYYCIQNGYVKDGINHYEEFTTEIMMRCVSGNIENNAILTRAELLHVINSDKMPNPCDKFLVLAIFEGIAGKAMEDIASLELDQFFSNKGKYVRLQSGRTLSVSKELYNYAVESSNEYDYTARLHFKEDDPCVLKELTNVVTSDFEHRKFNLSRRLMKIKRETAISGLSYGHLMDAGKIDMIKRFMAADKTDARTAMLKHKDEISERYNEIMSVRRFLLKYSQYF